MKKLEWYNLKACKEIRVQTLIAAGLIFSVWMVAS